MAEGQVKQVKQVLEKEIICALCLDRFMDPKKLPCDHVYCKDCLRGLALCSLNATISCPECRTLTQVPDNDVNNFPTAFQTSRLVEAFQKLQVQEGMDSVTEMCQVHPTQPLAIYCETCKKQLCRDCVLMSKEHAGHEYGYFKEVASKYREKVISKRSLIKTQEATISSALQEITIAETNMETCQDDVDHTFEEMISVLQACKEAMKDEVTAYNSSLRGVFDQQKKRLKDIQNKIESEITLIDTMLQDGDQSFLERMESTFERISNLQRKFQAISLTVAKPQLIAIQAADANSLRKYVKQNCFICEVAQADMCSLEGSFKLNVNKQNSFILTLCNPKGIICTYHDRVNRIDVDLVSAQSNSLTKGATEPLSQGLVKILLIPERRGLHQLNVKVNGAHIKNSPFTVTVYMPPKLLLQPVTIISGMNRPASLVYSQAEDKVTVTVIDEGIIRKVDSQLCLLPNKFAVLPDVCEITEDAELNIFYVTTQHTNRLHKLSNSGRIIKTVGQAGKGNAEFNLPNGLRVSKKHELYVRDSNNNRVQVFDLNLNFIRSFGKYGTGIGQFNFPADVDFDSHDKIYINDTKNYRIQVFTCTEHHIHTIVPEDPKVNLFLPVSLIIHDENLYVTDRYNHKVWVINTSGEVITTFGDGYLREPEGITMDKAGFVYVTSHKEKIVIF